jgi:hypothetical protein
MSCLHRLLSGPNRGNPCGQRAARGSDFCHDHRGSTIDLDIPDYCHYVYTKGRSEGQRCSTKCRGGALFCGTHADSGQALQTNHREEHNSRVQSTLDDLLDGFDAMDISDDERSVTVTIVTVSKGRRPKVPVAVRNRVITLWGQNCFACEYPLRDVDIEMGHIVSHSNGGGIDLPNLRPLCGSCNKSMGKKNMFDFMRTYGYNTAKLQLSIGV